MNYYNEFDAFAADWLENLIGAGLIPTGIVDRRSIKEVQPDDLQGYTQCHFFAGIAGWSEALRLAGWTGPCWTGSCPCQPYSSAGKRKGNADERNLWPDFYRLIAACRPITVIGEQVESAVGHGWLDGVFADLEREGYTCGAAVLGAHSIGAPHIRQRLFWVADTRPSPSRHNAAGQGTQASDGEAGESKRITSELGRRGRHRDGLANAKRAGVRLSGHRTDRATASGVQGTDGQREWVRFDAGPMRDAECDGMGNTTISGQCRGGTDAADKSPEVPGQRHQGIDRLGDTSSTGLQERISERRTESSEAGTSEGQTLELASCRDGKARRFESGSFPLAHAIPRRLGQSKSALASLARPASRNRVGRLRGYGNAIVPEVAAQFIKAFMEPTNV